MDEYQAYNQLRVMEDIAAQYPQGAQLREEAHLNAELVASRRYRVAVIGEFKRGKSSLLNALIGASVLPTDVIPLTAAITHLTYGTERKIIVRYKNGESEQKTLAELQQFATKYDPESEQLAASVREIEVQYPSVFCKNHIELLDTPGLNDNESMSAVTLSILGQIDAAIVVISVTAPLSLTEQNLILDLIRQEGVSHLVFVATFLDSLGSEAEKDRMLHFLRSRLTGELLEKTRALAEQGELDGEKAERILSNPDLFGVSSMQALTGFVNDDSDLLEQSRLPILKEELLAILTAAQSEDIPLKTAMIGRKVAGALPQWYEAELNSLTDLEQKLVLRNKARSIFAAGARTRVKARLQRMDSALNETCFSAVAGFAGKNLEDSAKSCFVQQLSLLRRDTLSHAAIVSALRSAKAEAENLFKVISEKISLNVSMEIDSVVSDYCALCDKALLSTDALRDELAEWKQSPFPIAVWEAEPILLAPNLVGQELMPTVSFAIQESIRAYTEKLNGHIQSWRVLLLRQVSAHVSEAEASAGDRDTREALLARKAALTFTYQQHKEKLTEITASLTKWLH